VYSLHRNAPKNQYVYIRSGLSVDFPGEIWYHFFTAENGDYAMAGLPVVSTQESQEYRNLLTEYNCGINCSVNSVQEVCEALKELIVNKEKRVEMGNNSRRLGEEKFDRRQSYKELVKVIESF
jgi:glycosyltransferase involved in cell wall biosynthesis